MPKRPSPRKPVAGWIEPDGFPVVVCDDGTTWRHPDDGWEEWTYPIPGTLADRDDYADPDDPDEDE